MNAILLVAALTTVSAQGTEPRVTVDGKRLEVGSAPKPYIEDNRLQVPMRAVFTAMGAEVQYLPALRQVVATLGDRQATVFLDENFGYSDGGGQYLDFPPRIIDGHVMVPLRFVSESLGAWVYWNQADLHATIRTPVATRPEQKTAADS